MKKILIFLGPPGSGKGTQAKKLAERYNYAHISTGDLFRALLNDPNAPADEIAEIAKMKQGKLVGDWLVYRLAFREIEKNIAEGQGVILDGAIRRLEQAQEFQKFFEEKGLVSEVTAIEIALSDEDSFDRLTKRRVCANCGEILPWTDKTAGLTSCPKCGGELILRQDDKPEVIKKRIEEQGNKTMGPIVKFYEELGALERVEGNRSIEEVDRDVEERLKIKRLRFEI